MCISFFVLGLIPLPFLFFTIIIVSIVNIISISYFCLLYYIISIFTFAIVSCFDISIIKAREEKHETDLVAWSFTAWFYLLLNEGSFTSNVGHFSRC